MTYSLLSVFSVMFTKISLLFLSAFVVARNRGWLRTSRERRWCGEGEYREERWRWALEPGSPESGARTPLACGKKILALLCICMFVFIFYRKMEQTYIRYIKICWVYQIKQILTYPLPRLIIPLICYLAFLNFCFFSCVISDNHLPSIFVQ